MILDTETYMKMSEHPMLIICGVKDDYITDLKEVKRDTPQRVRSICRDGSYGIVNFEDTFTITMPCIDDIYKAELYYGDELVSMRMFPPFFLQEGDTLQLKFKLQIYRTEEGVCV